MFFDEVQKWAGETGIDFTVTRNGLKPLPLLSMAGSAGNPRPVLQFLVKRKLGQVELCEAIEDYYHRHRVKFQRVTFPFKGPKNIGIVSELATVGA